MSPGAVSYAIGYRAYLFNGSEAHSCLSGAFSRLPTFYLPPRQAQRLRMMICFALRRPSLRRSEAARIALRRRAKSGAPPLMPALPALFRASAEALPMKLLLTPISGFAGFGMPSLPRIAGGHSVAACLTPPRLARRRPPPTALALL